MATASATIAQNLITAAWEAANAFGSLSVGGVKALPAMPAIQLIQGTGAGKIDRIGLASGTLTNVNPGTTDTTNLDLKNLTNMDGVAFTDMVKLVLALFLVDTAGAPLVVGNAGTANNNFVPLFNDITAGQIRVPGAYVSPVDATVTVPGIALFFGGDAGGLTVDATHKILKLFSGSAATLSWRAVILGRTA